MPIPIRLNNINDKENGGNNPCVDYSFLANLPIQEKKNKIVQASNVDADALLKIWTEAEKVGNNSFTVSSCNDISALDLKRLKSSGLVEIGKDIVKFTSNGKLIITTMALGENNAFLKNQKKVSYKEILASMDKRGKKGYRIPKMASNNNGITY